MCSTFCERLPICGRLFEHPEVEEESESGTDEDLAGNPESLQNRTAEMRKARQELVADLSELDRELLRGEQYSPPPIERLAPLKQPIAPKREPLKVEHVAPLKEPTQPTSPTPEMDWEETDMSEEPEAEESEEAANPVAFPMEPKEPLPWHPQYAATAPWPQQGCAAAPMQQYVWAQPDMAPAPQQQYVAMLPQKQFGAMAPWRTPQLDHRSFAMVPSAQPVALPAYPSPHEKTQAGRSAGFALPEAAPARGPSNRNLWTWPMVDADDGWPW